MPFTAEFEGRFAWGGVQIQLSVESGMINSVRVYSDAMDWSLAPRLEAALTGCRFTQAELAAALQKAEIEAAEDILTLLKENV